MNDLNTGIASSSERHPWRGVEIALMYSTKEGFDARASRCRLIDPRDAVEIIAFGGHGNRRHPARQWESFTPGHYSEMTYYEDEGREALARDLIASAVEDGRLQCAFARKGGAFPYPHEAMSHSLLFVVCRDSLLARAPTMSWDDGPIVQYGDDTAPDSFEEFLLFWDEVIKLDPRVDDQIERQLAHTFMSEIAPAHRPQTARRRGRRPNPHGGAIAAFLAQMVKEGVDDALARPDDSLGASLIEHYRGQGEYEPSLDNAGRDARAALQQWSKAAGCAKLETECR